MADTYTSGKAVVAYFETQSQAEKAIDALNDAGFTANQIGVAVQGVGGTEAPGTATTGGTMQTHANPEGSAKEHAVGAWDKVKNFFSGDGDVEQYADERASGDLASHEITTGATGVGYAQDDLHGSLAGLNVEPEHAGYFGNRFAGNAEGVLLTVSAGEKTELAERILEQNGGDVGRSKENFTASEGTAGAAATAGQNIQLFGEVLRVHKDRISRGEVRLRKEVHTETQTIQEPVTREELVIERVPVEGERATTNATGAFAEQEIRIPLSEERASVDKQTVLREEVHVGKREVSEIESVDGTTRREELLVNDETTPTKR